MKEVKIVIIATIITCLIIVSSAFALPAHAESRQEYLEGYPENITELLQTEGWR